MGLHRHAHRRGVAAQAGRSGGEPWWQRDNPSNMRDVGTIQELVDALEDAGDRLVIVEFYASWCVGALGLCVCGGGGGAR